MRSAAWIFLLAAAIADGFSRPAHAHAPAAERGDAGNAVPTVPFSVQDLVRLERLTDVAASPDGKRMVYTLRSTDMEANKGRTTLWLLDVAKRGSAPLHLTDGANDTRAAQWSGDGRRVYFLSNRSGSNQVWSTLPGEDAQQVTALPLDVGSFRVSPRGDRILVSLDVFSDCADLACTRERLEMRERAAAKGMLFEALMIRQWDTWNDGRRSQLFSVRLDAAGVARDLPVNVTRGIGDVPGKPFGGREDYEFSPDGTRVAFSARGVAGEAWSTNYDIYEVPADGSTPPRNLTLENPAWDAKPAFSPDGGQLAYLAQDRPASESDRFHLVLLDLKSGAKRPLTLGWDRSIVAFAWSRDGKTLIASADHLGQRPLWSIDAATGRVAALTSGGEIEDFCVGGSNVFYSSSNLQGPADLYSVLLQRGAPVRWTHLNDSLLSQRKLGAAQQFSFRGWNGEQVFGHLVKPVDFTRGARYPLAFLIHGGPQGSFGNAWSYRWNPQVFAGAGYGAVMIDFHGSTGYGQAFTNSINSDWGGKPLEDLKLGLKAVLEQNPWLDGERSCALGGSYGGFMVNWIAGQWPDRFKCLVSHDGIFDQRSMYYSTEQLWFPEHEFAGAEYANPGAYARFNPIDHVMQWRTPMLIIHGAQDFRVPDVQGLSMFTALQRRGIASELLYFPSENHWVLKPADSIQWYDTVLSWLHRWTTVS